MDPKFNDELELKNNRRTVAAWGPCNWKDDDDWAEIGDVIVEQSGVFGSSNGTTTVRKGEDEEWWLEASSYSEFTPGRARAHAVAIVRKTDGTTYEYPWPHYVRLR